MGDLKTALVLGMGVSGEAAALLPAHRGVEVTIVDSSAAAGEGERYELLRSCGVRVSAGGTELPSGNFDICVVSPGIADDSAWVLEMERRGTEVVSELELGYRYCKCPLIAVTGTNGKSTLVKLLYEILIKAGKKAEIAGNYGIPLCEVAERSSELDWIVVEVSSFQLEKVVEFHPEIGVLLNIQPDHLDRHGSMEKYRELKSRLFRCMTAKDVGIVELSEAEAVRTPVSGKNSWVSFGSGRSADVYYDADGGKICGYGGLGVDISDSPFDNPVMGQTAAAAVAVARACGIDLDIVSEAVKNFEGLSHRMEQVVEVKGVSFVDDSKATNLAALKAGLEMTRRPVRLIAGGQLKEKSVEFVKEVLANRAVCVYVIGDAAKVFEAEWGGYVKCEICTDLETAVRTAWRDAVCGDIILLSPGCASFDQFRSYKDRGEQFRRIAEKINEEDKHENIVCN